MTPSDNFESFPPFFRPNQGVDHDKQPPTPEPGRESVPESDSLPHSDSDLDPLPVIDFQKMDPEKLGKVCREWGVFRLANHGVPTKLLSQLHEYANKLFSLSFESKQALPTSPIIYFWGSPSLTISGNAKKTGPSTQKLNWLEGFHVPLTKTSQVQNEDPLIESFRSLTEEYGNHQTRLAKALFTTIAEHLNLPPTKSESYLSPSTGLLRVYRYLRCPLPEKRWGISQHTDSSVFTILHQDQVGGLQVYNNNEWVDVKPIHDTLIVNIGDMLQALSNDCYISVLHRVRVQREKERTSIGYFVFPAKDAVIESSTYRSFTYADFQAEMEVDLKAVGEKIGLPRFKKELP